MTLSNSRLSYDDCFEVMDRAIQDPKGVRVKCPTYEKAITFRVRLHKARALDRKRNGDLYEPDHPMSNVSIYDKLVVRIRRQGEVYWVYIEQNSIEGLEVELLSDLELEDEALLPGPPEALRLPAPVKEVIEFEGISKPGVLRRI